MRTTVFSLSVVLTIFAVSQAILNPGNQVCAQDAELISTSLTYPRVAPISGRIIDESGLPVPGAVVIQYSKSTGSAYDYFGGGKGAKHEICNQATTDILGKFKFKNWDYDHNTRVYVMRKGYPLTQIRNKLSIFGDTVLKKGTDVSGRILTRDGKPVKDAEVEVAYTPDVETTKVAYYSTKTNSKGAFQLNNVAVDGRVSLWLKIEDQYFSQINWFENEDVSGLDQTRQQSPDKVAIGDDFRFLLPEKRPITFSVVSIDSDKPVEVESVCACHSPNVEGLEPMYPRGHFYVAKDKNKISYDFLKTGYNRFYIFPSKESKHSPFFYDVVLAEGETPPKDLVAKVPEGALITGTVVDAATGRGIPNAPVRFMSETPGALLNENYYPRQRCFTEESGTFSCVLPAGAWKVRVSGDCGNYCIYPTGLDWNLPQTFQGTADGSYKQVMNKFTVPSNLEKRFEPAEGETIDAGIFKLNKSVVAKGTVVDADGKPVSNVAFISEPERYVFSRKRFGKTDEQGKFKIENLFTNGIDDLHKQGSTTTGEAELFFWHHEKRMSASIKVQKDDCDSIEVTLVDSPVAWGRVVDSESGKPLVGVQMFGNHSIGFLQMGAYTRDDGSYLLEYCPRKGIFLSCSKPNYKSDSLQIGLQQQADKNVLVLEQPDFKMQKMHQNSFGIPDKPDVTGLSAEETVETLSAHIAKQLERLPDDPNPNRWDSRDPDTQFKFQVSKDVSEIVEKLLDENKDPAFQRALSLQILLSLSNPKGGSTIMNNTGVYRMREVLAQNLDHEGVLEAYEGLNFTMRTSRLLVVALDSSTSPIARKWAAGNLLSQGNSELQDGSRLGFMRQSNENFELRLASTKKAWATLLSEFPDVPVHGTLDYRTFTGLQVQSMIQRIRTRPHDEERLEAIIEAADSLGLLENE